MSVWNLLADEFMPFLPNNLEYPKACEIIQKFLGQGCGRTEDEVHDFLVEELPSAIDKFKPAMGWAFYLRRRWNRNPQTGSRATWAEFNAEAFADAQPGPAEKSIAKEQARGLKNAIDDLKPQDRAVIVLHYLENWEYKDIAEALAKTEGAVKVQSLRAIRQAREYLKDTHFFD